MPGVNKQSLRKVSDCQCCGENLSDVVCVEYEWRTKINIIFEKVVSHADTEIKVSPGAGCKAKGVFLKICKAPCSMVLGSRAVW